MATTLEKIRVLGSNGKFDICASTASNRSEKYPTLYDNSAGWVGSTIASGVCHSYTPDGRCVSLFKVLYTNKCIYSCKYCFTQVCKERLSFTPEEYARTFMKLYTMNVTEGVFISSGVCGSADETTKEMLETVKLLRFKYKFRGYIHFKCLPGVSAYLLKEAIALADRISINLEAPTKEHLADIASQKSFDTDIITRQRWLKEIRMHHNNEVDKVVQDFYQDARIDAPSVEKWEPLKPSQVNSNGKPAVGWLDDWGQLRKATGYLANRWDGAPIMNSGQTTQFCLGAAGESDFDVLKRLDWAYREVDLRRGYFSAFDPIAGTPLEKRPATPLDREHRLYQTDWLLRIYNFRLKEIKDILTPDGNLPLGDPKIFLARNYFGEHANVDVNTATQAELLRVPGIGARSATRIIEYRRQEGPITSRAQLHHIGVVLKRADPFLKVNGTCQSTLDSFCSKMEGV